MAYLFEVGLSSAMFAYLVAIPFYVLCEKPCRNFIDLILFPKNTIFKKVKDVEDEESEEETDDEYHNEQEDIDGRINKSTLLSTFD